MSVRVRVRKGFPAPTSAWPRLTEPACGSEVVPTEKAGAGVSWGRRPGRLRIRAHSARRSRYAPFGWKTLFGGLTLSAPILFCFSPHGRCGRSIHELPRGAEARQRADDEGRAMHGCRFAARLWPMACSPAAIPISHWPRGPKPVRSDLCGETLWLV